MPATATKTILDTIKWAKTLNFGRRSGNHNEMEPAITSANMVMQTILGAPFAWRWNNINGSFTCLTDGTQDYTVNIPTFGWLEYASIQDIADVRNPAKWIELQPQNSLSLDSELGSRPMFICPQTEDVATGNIVFRVSPAPHTAYPVSFQVQESALLITSLNQTWGPIPDYLSYIYNWGFLSFMYMFADDPRFGMANQKFIAHLLGAQEGITETQRNIFLANWDLLTMTQKMQAQQGNQARQT